MKVVQWSAPERIISQTEASDFYDRPLAEPWLFHFTTQHLHIGTHAASFSLKLVVRGQERYRFGSRQLCLRPGQLLFSDAERSYSSEISRPSECISLFLPPDMASEAWDDSTAEHGAIVDGTKRRSVDRPVPVAFASSSSVRDLTATLLSSLRCGADSRHAAFEFVSAAAQQWRNVAPVRELTGPRSAATREELIGRVVRARLMIDDLHGRGIDLGMLADEACLSKFHLLRVFREAFGLTPGQYARQARIKRAAELQRCGRSLGAATRLAGYSRPGSLKRARSKAVLDNVG
jgi:AraC-like DNA-binding protein